MPTKMRGSQSRRFYKQFEAKSLIGMTGNTLKEHFNNHKKSLTKIEYRNNMELSKYAWDWKEKEREFSIQWPILRWTAGYSSVGKSCRLCLQEKLCILNPDNTDLLKRKYEVYLNCVHPKRFLARIQT